MTEPLTLQRDLKRALPLPIWPEGISLIPFTEDMAPALHALMAAGYTAGEGDAGPFDTWWRRLRADIEYDPALVFVAASADGTYAGICQCWTSAFVKDLVVAEPFRGRGIGEALMLTACHAFTQRGAERLALKVLPGNARALKLYRRLGMTEA